MLGRRFTKQQLYEKFPYGTWQEKWSRIGHIFVTLQEWGVAVLTFPSSGGIYIKDGEDFIFLGRDEDYDGGYKIEYPEIFGSGYFVGYVSLPTSITVVESSKGFVGTKWEKRECTCRLEKEGLVLPSRKEKEEWVGRKVKFEILLGKYKRFAVRGKQWEETFVRWEEKKKQIRMDFFFRFGLQFVDRFPPRRHLAPSEYREYVAMLGEHMWWKKMQEQEREEEELIKNIWGKYENILGEYEEEGFHLIDPVETDEINGPIEVLAFLKFLSSGNPFFVLNRRPSPYIIPPPLL